MLRDALDARHVSVGENFRYGHGAHGTTETLAAEGARLGFDVDGRPAPSGRRRARVVIADPRAPGRRRRWRRPPRCWAVRRGSRVPSCAATAAGRDLGFPTANLSPLPRDAAARRRASTPGAHTCPDSDHTAAISIGYNPTFTDSRDAVRIEAYLLDFDRDIYGSPIRLQLTHRLRDELRFDSVDALVEQLHRDVERTRELAG